MKRQLRPLGLLSWAGGREKRVRRGPAGTGWGTPEDPSPGGPEGDSAGRSARERDREGQVSGGPRRAHLLLRAGELLLHVASDLPRRHPLAAHLGHRGAGLSPRRAPKSRGEAVRTALPAPSPSPSRASGPGSGSGSRSAPRTTRPGRLTGGGACARRATRGPREGRAGGGGRGPRGRASGAGQRPPPDKTLPFKGPLWPGGSALRGSGGAGGDGDGAPRRELTPGSGARPRLGLGVSAPPPLLAPRGNQVEQGEVVPQERGAEFPSSPGCVAGAVSAVSRPAAPSARPAPPPARRQPRRCDLRDARAVPVPPSCRLQANARPSASCVPDTGLSEAVTGRDT